MSTMERRDAALVEWTKCSIHPDVSLPIPLVFAEAFLCYRCVQESRLATYKRQKEEANERLRSFNSSITISEEDTTISNATERRITEAAE